MSDWFSQECPHCGHRAGMHASFDGVCIQVTKQSDGPWTSCSCPGWWPDELRHLAGRGGVTS